MDRKTKWRTFWLSLLTVLAICVMIPSLVPSQNLPIWFNQLFDKKMQYGLDLQGGLYIVYSIDLDKAVDDKASEIKRDVEAKLEDIKVKGKATTPAVPVGGVNIFVDDPNDLAKIDSKFLSDYDEYVSTVSCPADSQGKAVCMRVSSDYAEGIRESALHQAILTIRERINQRGVAEPSVKKKGRQIIVELPGLDEKETARVKDIIARTAKLEFKMVEYAKKGNTQNADYMIKLGGYVGKDPAAAKVGITSSPDYWSHEKQGQFSDFYLRASDEEHSFTIEQAKTRGCYNRNKREFQGKVKCLVSGRERIQKYVEELVAKDKQWQIDEDHELSFELVRPTALGDEEERDPYWRTHYLRRAVELGGSSIDRAYVSWDPQTNRPVVIVNFDRYGGRRSGDMTGANVGNRMAIILDDKVISAPTIQTAIRGGSTMITMGGNNNAAIQAEAEDLVAGLKTGSLPAPLQEESSAVIGPLLGKDAVDKAKFAFALGSLLVVIIMIWVYRFSGVISIIALVLNILFMISILTTFGATLTLPGIAALVLTVGMAVDANIIIYERIREELRAGKSIRGAVDAGFSRGFAAIFDGQLTTGVAAYVLMQYGSGPIRGFAVMLIIGIVCTLFTATWCTRLFFEYYVGKGRKVSQIAI